MLFFACAMQWLQAAAGVLYNNSYRTVLSQVGGPELEEATWLSLLGVLVLAIGMRAALLGMRPVGARMMAAEVERISPLNVFSIYLLFLIVFTLVRRVAFHFPSLTQPLLASTSIEWVPVILLAQFAVTEKRGQGLLAVVVMVEFAIGFLGYFSSFKGVFLLLIVVLLTTTGSLPGRRWLALSLVAFFLLLTGCIWSSIKGEYREFLNGGTGQEEVNEPVQARLGKLLELVRSMNKAKLDEGLDRSMQRIGYVELFSKCIANVPEAHPYEHGALWLGAVQHTLMPRLLFPNKPTIDDSLRTQKYTGIAVAGQEQGTSIGIGYIAESYIDFGPYLMFLPVFLLGLFYGLVYRFFASRSTAIAVAMASGIALLVFGAYNIETSNIKLVGGSVVGLLALAIFYRFCGSTFLRLVSEPPNERVGVSSRRKPGRPLA